MNIPDDVAQSLGVYHRNEARTAPTRGSVKWHSEMADLLEPQPSSLREQVADLLDRKTRVTHPDQVADAVLAVVADWLAAQPLTGLAASSFRHAEQNERDHDVALIRGGAS